MKFFIIIALYISSIFSAELSATKATGTMPSYMGGVYSSSYNPSLLNKSKHSSWDFSLGTMIKLTTNDESVALLNDMKVLVAKNENAGFTKASSNLVNAIEVATNVDNATKLNNYETIKLGTKKEDAKTITSAIHTIKNLNDLKLDFIIGAGLDARFQNYSLGFYENASMRIIPHININKTQIIQKANIPDPSKILQGDFGAKKPAYFTVDLVNDSIKQTTKTDYDNNSIFQGVDELKKSIFMVKARTLMEVPFSYSYRHNLNYNSFADGYLNLGLSAKYMVLKEKDMRIKSDEMKDIAKKGQSYFTDLLDAKSYYNGSLDFGILYYPRKINGLKTSLVIKNITSPSFGDSRYNAKPMIKYGIFYRKWGITTAFDVDITKNKTLSDNYTQIIGTDLGYRPFSWLGFSAGYKMDLAKEKSLGEHGGFITLGMQLPIFNISVQSVDFDTNQAKSFQVNIDLAI